jgi:hypothetical protein
MKASLIPMLAKTIFVLINFSVFAALFLATNFDVDSKCYGICTGITKSLKREWLFRAQCKFGIELKKQTFSTGVDVVIEKKNSRI